MYKSFLRIEIADTPHKQQQGLMFRKKLEDDAGMLFKFNNPQKLKFWGVNTYIPLDIAFISPNNTISKISHIKPLSNKIVYSDEDCHIAIEANLDYFKKNKIKIGDKIDLSLKKYVYFSKLFN